MTPSQSSPGTRAAQSAATRTALLEAAKRVFAARGYLNTKITDVTAEAGRAAGSFYSHFASKDELLEALLHELGSIGDELAESPGHRTDFRDPQAVRFHVAVYWRVAHRHASTLRALYQASLVNEEFAARLAAFRRAQYLDLAGHLAYVAQPPAAAGASIAMMVGVFEQVTQLDLPENDAIEAVTRFVYRALNGHDYP